MSRACTRQVAVLALGAALLLASNQTVRPDNWTLAGQYIYWMVRIFLEAGLFLAFAELLARQPVLEARPIVSNALAALVSLPPFVLAITALDLVLGLPELQGTLSPDGSLTAQATGYTDGGTRLGSLLNEILYLADNHLALCLLLCTPWMVSGLSSSRGVVSDTQTNSLLPASEARPGGADEPEGAEAAHTPNGSGFRRHLDKPIEEDLLRIEAQEHYVKLVSASQSAMLLYRFNDITSEIAPDLGMQVHRSHWVAYKAVEKLIRKNGRLWLNLCNGTQIPVSRKYAQGVRARFEMSDTE